MRQAILGLALLPLLLAAQPARLSLTISLRLSDSQQLALDSLLAAQQDPSSPHFRRWLSPEDFADRFGAEPHTLERLSAWLRSQGLSVDSTARSRTWLSVSGSPEQIGRALSVEFRSYRDASRTRFAATRVPRFPAEFSPLIGGVLGLDDAYPEPQQNVLPGSPDGGRSIVPEDIAVIYNLSPLHRTGFDGNGVRIVVTGASDIETTDIDTFRTRFNLPPIKLQKVLASAQTPPRNARAATEANLDLQWVGAVARNADLVYVYAADVRNALLHAVDKNLGQIISYSAGQCEAQASSVALMLRTVVQQANAQGMTVLAASGDSGPANCEPPFESLAAARANSVMLPASIPEVTAIGGTVLTSKDGPYWRPAPDFRGISAVSYVPEFAWNDTAAMKVLAAGGGGPSALFARPNWQTGRGVPAGTQRLTPDLSFAASSYSNGYIFRDGGAWRVGGGTSVSTPVFAGILAVLNQYLLNRNLIPTPGLGNINPSLYRLYQDTPSIFHDIDSGDTLVPCVASSPDCVNGRTGYVAAQAYDLATGLGSVDANLLITRWDSSPALVTNLLFNPSDANPSFNDIVQFNVIVRTAGSATPAGPVSFFLANTPEPTAPGFNSATYLGSAQLVGAGGAATASLRLQAGLLNVGRNTVVAYFAGSPLVNSSSASAVINVRLPGNAPAVQVTATPREVPEDSPDANGNRWFFRLQLKELAGFLSTITSFTIDGVEQVSQVRTLFGTNTLQAFGTLTANIAFRGANIQAPYDLRIALRGQDSGGETWQREIVVPLGLRRQLTSIAPGGLVNGASFTPRLAPGMLATAFGQQLSANTGQATALPLPYTLGASAMTINGIGVPFYFASPQQLNFQIPYEIQPGNATLTLSVDLPTGQRETYSHSFVVSPAAPGIFAGPNNTLVPFSSGKRNDTLLLFVTGDGALDPPLATATSPSPSTPIERLPKPRLPLRVTIGGIPANLLFVGVPPGLAGTTQVNFTIPPNAPLGLQDVVVTVGDFASPPVKLQVQP